MIILIHAVSEHVLSGSIKSPIIWLSAISQLLTNQKLLPVVQSRMTIICTQVEMIVQDIVNSRLVTKFHLVDHWKMAQDERKHFSTKLINCVKENALAVGQGLKSVQRGG
jgi:hypothetical protein